MRNNTLKYLSKHYTFCTIRFVSSSAEKVRKPATQYIGDNVAHRRYLISRAIQIPNVHCHVYPFVPKYHTNGSVPIAQHFLNLNYICFYIELYFLSSNPCSAWAHVIALMIKEDARIDGALCAGLGRFHSPELLQGLRNQTKGTATSHAMDHNATPQHEYQSSPKSPGDLIHRDLKNQRERGGWNVPMQIKSNRSRFPTNTTGI